MTAHRLLVPALAGIVLVAPVLGGPSVLDAGKFDRSAIIAGEWLRLLTAHVVHLDLRHAALNGAAAALIVVAFGDTLSLLAWCIVVALSAAAVDIGLWFLSPQVEWYAGASGLQHGAVVAGALSLPSEHRLVRIVIVLAIASKLLIEGAGWSDPLISGMPVVSAAHLYGAAGGALAFMLVRKSRPSISSTFI